MKMLRNSTRAEDAVQDTLLKAMAKCHLFEPGTNLKAWLFTIMRNDIFSRGRKARREVSDPDGIFAATLFVNEGQSWAFDLKVLAKRMRQLNSVQRKAIQLVAIEQREYEEASEMMGIPVGTVKSSVSRARAFLETGDDTQLRESAPQVVTILPSRALVAELFVNGLSISEIQARVPGLSRSEVMQIVTEAKVSGRRKRAA